MQLTVALGDGKIACAESLMGFQRAVDGFSEYELLGGTRCHGWTRLDALVHVLAGWQDMLLGLVSVSTPSRRSTRPRTGRHSRRSTAATIRCGA